MATPHPIVLNGKGSFAIENYRGATNNHSSFIGIPFSVTASDNSGQPPTRTVIAHLHQTSDPLAASHVPELAKPHSNDDAQEPRTPPISSQSNPKILPMGLQ